MQSSGLVPKENCYDRRTCTSLDGWQLHLAVPGSWTLPKPVLVPFHGFCWPESVSVWFHELVPDDDVFAQTWSWPIGEREHAQLGLGSVVSCCLRRFDCASETYSAAGP